MRPPAGGQELAPELRIGLDGGMEAAAPRPMSTAPFASRANSGAKRSGVSLKVADSRGSGKTLVGWFGFINNRPYG